MFSIIRMTNTVFGLLLKSKIFSKNKLCFKRLNIRKRLLELITRYGLRNTLLTTNFASSLRLKDCNTLYLR